MKIPIYSSLIVLVLFFAGLTAIQAQTAHFEWAEQFNSNNDCRSYVIATDHSGNVYTAGTFVGTVDLGIGGGTGSLASLGGMYGGANIFIAKFNASGKYVWAKQIGTDVINAITIDASGNIYFTGSFHGTVNFDPDSTYNMTAFFYDAYVCKLDASGKFIWAKQFSGNASQVGIDIAVDAAHNVYTTGYFGGFIDFTGYGTDTISTYGGSDIFVSKLDASGNFIWAKRMGGAGDNVPYSIALDNTGNVYTTGWSGGTADFDPGTASYNLTAPGYNPDAFISKLDASGNFAWAKLIGSGGVDYGTGIATDTSGEVYVTGAFDSTVDFDPGSGVHNITTLGGSDIFVLKLDATGNFIWAKQIGSTGNDVTHSIAIDAAENVYTGGEFDANASVSKLDAYGNSVWDKHISGGALNYSNGMCLDFSNNVYVMGYFNATCNFNTDGGTTNFTTHFYDGYLFKLSQPAGIVNSQLNNSLNVYPIPAKDYIVIENGDDNFYSINGLEGKVLVTGKITSQKQPIDLSALPSNIYLLHFTNKNGERRFVKIVKE